MPSPLGQTDDHSEHFIVRSSCLFSICWVVTGLLVFAIKSVIYVLFNVKNAMFLPKRSLPICQWSRMPGLVDLVALVTNQVDRWPSSKLAVARGLCACLVHPNNMGKGTTRSYRCEFIKRWAISGAQREVYFNLHTNCSHWFAQRAATTTIATATTTRKA